MTNTSTVTGYPRNIFIDLVDDKFLCAECALVLRQPRQSQCGHRFCAECANSAARNEDLNEYVLGVITYSKQEGACQKEKEPVSSSQCAPDPTCKSCVRENALNEFSTIRPGEMFPDRAVEREIQQKKVKCPNQGCDFVGLCRGYDEHERQCRFKPAICPRCQNAVPEPMLEDHINKDCPERIIKCRFCQQSFRNADKEQHNYSCPKFPLRCGGCGRNKIPRDIMNDHILSCETACPYQTLGCAPVEVRDLASHFKEHSQDHQLLLVKGVLGKDNKLAQEVDNYLKSSVGGLEGRLRAVEQGGASAGVLSAKTEECYQQLVVHTEVIKVLKNEISSLHQACNTVAEGAQAQQTRILELENKIRQLERTLSLKDVALAEQDLRLRSLELTSYEGTLLWKITDFKKKRDDAIAGRTISVYSPAFYTSRTGYKMCGRIYLNGDGMGKGSHISLFFVIMRGHYDNLLKWPFRQKVTFMLLDQNQHEHVIDAFRPDPNSTSFKCPTSEMNIASGCPLFVPLTHLENASSAYVKDDTIFIKIIVDCSDLN